MGRKIKLSEYPVIRDRHVLNKEKPSFIAKDYKVNEITICKILKSMNCLTRSNTRIYFFNENFFEKIDTEEKAYYLGLIYSDGNVKGNQMRLSLAEPDQYLLEKHREILTNCPKLKLVKKRKEKHKQKYLLELTSKKYTDFLKEKGVVPKKSLILKFPTEDQVPRHLMCHFLRGYFDGDGSLSKTKGGNNVILGFTSSESFCSGLREFLLSELNIEGLISGYKHSKANDLKLSTRKAFLLLDYIYSNSTIRMERKFLKFLDFLTQVRPHSLVHSGGSSINNQIICDIVNKWTDNNLKVSVPKRILKNYKTIKQVEYNVDFSAKSINSALNSLFNKN